MIKLLKANFSRLKKELSLWIVAGVTLALTVPKIVDSYKMALRMLSLMMCFLKWFLLSVFCMLCLLHCILARNTAIKAMRNKLIVGHKKRKYLSCKFYNLLFSAPLLFFSMFLLGNFCVGVPLVGGWKGEISTLITYIPIIVCFTAAIASVLTLLCMLCSKHAVSAVLAITIALLLMVIASVIYNALVEPEITRDVHMTLNGMELGDPMPNPLYVSGGQKNSL